MKSWRSISAAAVVVFTAAPALVSAGACAPDLNLKKVCGLAMCAERQNNTSANLGNGFPWENSTFFFSAFRNQFLYPSSTVATVGTTATTIESMHARAVSFTGASTNVYAAGSHLRVNQTPVGTLQRQFSLNPAGAAHFTVNGAYTIGHATGYTSGIGNHLSDCVSGCGGTTLETRNAMSPIINTSPAANLLVDALNRVGTGNSGNGVWDVTSGACSGPSRAYGSGTFVNLNALTTAYGVDNMAFVWVFCGKALPPPSSVQQQISEIIRLLLTPESLRCSGIDLVNDQKLSDDAFLYPAGKDYDPISPRVTSGGIITGEEGGGNSKRNQGW